MEKKKMCPICGKSKSEEIVNTCKDSYDYIIKTIKQQHPEWVEEDGLCPKCIEYYKKLGK